MSMKFELTSLPRNCSDEEIVAEVKRVDSIVNKSSLTRADYDRYGKMSSSAIARRFGGWHLALRVAGLPHKYSGRRISEKMRQQSKSLTDGQVIEELRTIAHRLQQDHVTQRDVNVHSELISASTVYYRFGSWAEGVRRAGLRDSPGYNRKFSEDEYVENLLNVWTYYGRQPSYSEMRKPPSVIGPKTYESHYGTWRKALQAFVAKMNQDSSGNSSDEPSLLAKESEGTVREEISRHSVLVEDRRQVGIGLRYKVLSRDRFRCAKCGSSPALDPNCMLHIDHIVPFSKGGRTTLENLQTLCKECNLGKGDSE